MNASIKRTFIPQFNEDVAIGDMYINIKAKHLGIRIADENTIKSLRFAKAIAWGQCFITKVIPNC